MLDPSLQLLSRETIGRLTGDLSPMADSGFSETTAILTPGAATKLQDLAEHQLPPAEQPPLYCLVECPSGEWPMLKTYKKAEALARRLSELQKTDTVAWAFYGTPLPFTRLPHRYLRLPGNRQVVSIPADAKTLPQRLPVITLPELEDQSDGFIGPPELAETPESAESGD